MKKGLLILICCKVCNKIFTIPEWKWNQRKNKLFACSNECRWKGNERKAKTKCSYSKCNKSIKIHLSQYKRTDKNYCSVDCRANDQFKRVITKCSNIDCNKELSIQEFSDKKSEYHFCNRKCHAEFKDQKVEIKCLNCGKKKSKSKCLVDMYDRNYCSNECYYEHSVGENSHMWKGGKSLEFYPPEFNRKLKVIIRERDNFKCQICDDEENGKAHSIHHIDYNKQNTFFKNLITLCGSCHSKTNGNRKYWQKVLQHININNLNIGQKPNKAKTGNSPRLINI